MKKYRLFCGNLPKFEINELHSLFLQWRRSLRVYYVEQICDNSSNDALRRAAEMHLDVAKKSIFKEYNNIFYKFYGSSYECCDTEMLDWMFHVMVTCIHYKPSFDSDDNEIRCFTLETW